MKKRKYIVVLFFAVAAALCLAFAIGTGCKNNKTYEIKFDTGTHTSVESIYAGKDEVITLPEPEKEDGWAFKAWYLKKDCTGDGYEANSSYTVTGKTKFYGSYVKEAEIRVDLGGGKLEKTSFSLEVGGNVLDYMSQYVPEYEHHLFDYWADENGKEIKNTLTMPEEGLTLIAVYKVEVSAQVWVWDDDEQKSATHYSQYDVISYEKIGDKEIELYPNTPTGISESKKQSGDGRLAEVDEDYEKNVIQIYYDKNNITWSFDSNYPVETGLNSGTIKSGECVFGEYVEVPADLTCYGYLLVGWATNPGATVPEYAVDLLTPYTMVYDSSEKAYVIGGGYEEVWCMPEETRTTFFAVWYRGYFDMFGSYDVVYDFGEGDTVYLSRGGVFWESQPYNSSNGYYTFVNSANSSSNVNGGIYRVTLKESGYFVFYDENYINTSYYRVYPEYMSGYDCMIITVSEEYFYFTASGNVEYVDENGTSYATYDYDEDGYSTLTFIDGRLSGRVYSLLLVTLDDAGSAVNGFILRDDTEAGKEITFGGIGYTEEGGFGGIVDEKDYYVELSGYSTCEFYIYGETYSYYYILDDDTLMLFSTTYSESYYGYPLGAIYKYSSDFGRWLYYYSALDRELTLYSDAHEKIGTVELDGIYRGTVEKDSGEKYEVIFTVDSFAIGDVVMLFSGGENYYDYWPNLERYVYDYEESYETGENGDAVYTYYLTKIPEGYSESYFYNEEGLSSYQIFGIEEKEEGKGTATLYLYGYSILAGSYIYFSVWEGEYEIVTDETYGFTYYKISEITPTNDYDFYGISDIYTSSYSYSELMEMTEVGFIIGKYTWMESGYEYEESVNIWYYYKAGEGEEAIKHDLSTIYEGQISVSIGDETYSAENSSLLVLGNFAVYGKITCNDSTLFMEGIISEKNEYWNKDLLTITISKVTFLCKCEEENEDGYTEDIYIEFEKSEDSSTFKTYDKIDYIYFEYIASPEEGEEEGLESGSYIYYDILGENSSSFTFVFGENTYIGTVSIYLDTSGRPITTSTGRTVYKFVSEEGCVEFTFVFALYSGEEGENIPIFVKYEETDYTVYFGKDGSTFATDGTGLEGAFTVGGITYTVDYSVIHEGDGTGHYQNGYITFQIDGVFYILDFVDENTGYDYEIRGQEYWYTFYVVDNQILKSYYMQFDGYDSLKILKYEDEKFSKVGEGSYSVVDNIVTYTWWYTEEVGAEYFGEGVLDYVAGDTFAVLYISREEFSATLVDSADFSVLTLDGCGDAFRYLTDGSIEFGQYTVLDSDYLYYVSGDEDTVIVYGYDLKKGIARAVDYKGAYMYYTGDMTKSVYLTNYGRLTLDSYTYYYFVREEDYIYIYYVPEDEKEANEYGYKKSKGIYLGSQITLNDTTYTYMQSGSSFTLKRDSSDNKNFGALAETYDEDAGEYDFITYYLGDLTFYREESDEYYADGTIILTDENGNEVKFKDDDGKEYSISITFAREAVGDGKYEISIDMYVSDYSEVLFYSYDDTFLYTLEISLTIEENKNGEKEITGGTYKVKSMDLYVPMLSFENEYLVYEADYYYGMFEVYWFEYEMEAQYGGGYNYDLYYAAYECYTYAEYLYELADYYYSEVYLIYNYNENCEFTGNLYSTGYFMPYLITDANGNKITFDREPVTLTSEGYYISFVGGDGITYSLTFLQDYTFYDMGYTSLIAFDTVAFQWIANYETDKDSDGNKYIVTTGTLIYSDYYYDYEGEIWSIGLTKVDGEGGETQIDALVMLEIEGDIYFVGIGADDMPVYYKVVYSFDGDGEISGVEVGISEDIKTYTYTKEGEETLYVDVFEKEGEEEILLVYGKEGENGEVMYYRVTESAKFEEGNYLVTLTGGSVYIITLESSGCENSADMEKVDVIFTTELEENKYIISKGSEGKRVYYKIEYNEDGVAIAQISEEVTTYEIAGVGSLDVLGGSVVLIYFESGEEGYYLVESCVEVSEGQYLVTLTDGSMYTVSLDSANSTATLQKYEGSENAEYETESSKAEPYAASFSFAL